MKFSFHGAWPIQHCEVLLQQPKYLPWGCSLYLPSQLWPHLTLNSFCQSVFQASKPNIFSSTGFHWQTGNQAKQWQQQYSAYVPGALLTVYISIDFLCYPFHICTDALTKLTFSISYFVWVSKQIQIYFIPSNSVLKTQVRVDKNLYRIFTSLLLSYRSRIYESVRKASYILSLVYPHILLILNGEWYLYRIFQNARLLKELYILEMTPHTAAPFCVFWNDPKIVTFWALMLLLRLQQLRNHL